MDSHVRFASPSTAVLDTAKSPPIDVLNEASTCVVFRESDLRYFAEKYGPVRDVYLPRDYYTGYGRLEKQFCAADPQEQENRPPHPCSGFGFRRDARGIRFVEYTNSRDAEDAKYQLDKMVLLGREVS